jgi:ABC-2 type transport system permease protein
MNSFLKLTQMQIKLFMREPIAFFFTLVFPLLLLLLFGAMFGNEANPQFGGFGYIDGEVPGLTGIIIGTVGLLSIPVSTATARERKILRRYQATPLRPLTYFAADVVVNYAVSLIGLILLVVAATFIFDLRFGGNWLAVWAAFTLCALAFSAAGYVVASLSPTGRIAQVVGQVLYLPMMFLSGATMPVQIMPDGLRAVSNWLPLTHVVKLLQDLWFGGGWNTTSLIVMTLMLVLGTAASLTVFRWE